VRKRGREEGRERERKEGDKNEGEREEGYRGTEKGSR